MPTRQNASLVLFALSLFIHTMMMTDSSSPYVRCDRFEETDVDCTVDTFNHASTDGSGSLSCSRSVNSFATLRKSGDFVLSTNGEFTMSFWFRIDGDSDEDGASIRYLLSLGDVPGSGTSRPYFAVALPGNALASRDHLRLYFSTTNHHRDEIDFIDVQAPPNDGQFHHVVIVQRSNVARPDIYLNNYDASQADVNRDELLPKIPWWVCGACKRNNAGYSAGLNCWHEYGGCPSCRSENSEETDGCSSFDDNPSLRFETPLTFCTRSDEPPRRSFDGTIACLSVWNDAALTQSEVHSIYSASCAAVSDEDKAIRSTTTAEPIPTTRLRTTEAPTVREISTTTASALENNNDRDDDAETPSLRDGVSFEDRLAFEINAYMSRESWWCILKVLTVAFFMFVAAVISHVCWNPRCTKSTRDSFIWLGSRFFARRSRHKTSAQESSPLLREPAKSRRIRKSWTDNKASVVGEKIHSGTVVLSTPHEKPSSLPVAFIENVLD